ncbi:RNA polymerase sigma factor SigJ [Ferrimicrobium sp.]|uniref:RNA polymerase sigma factor SigJ n=1 Tax=Ferrimicrobium sp. TaxID=2926050 RepID=UPI002620A884|nr:RNA polymerase sigma factor SigJ [Ferrimicrobium sp.]
MNAFEKARPRLLGFAYRITGSLVDAEDVVSEVWLRWAEADQDAVINPQGWLTTVTVRRAIDWARAGARRRETYLGPWLPEPVVTARRTNTDPEAAAELAESLALGFLIVLDRLDPVARAVFLLADVWGWSFAEVAVVVGRSEAACRQLASRARKRLQAATAAPTPWRVTDEEMVHRLVVAVTAGNLEMTLSLLAPDVVLVSDGGPSIHAARRPVVTSPRVANFLLNLARRLPAVGDSVDIVTVNGTSGIIVHASQAPKVVMAFEFQDERVTRIWTILAPEKLRRLDNPPNLQ